MALVLQLTDGTTTLDLNDGTSYRVAEGGLSLPAPPLRQVWGGENPYRIGSDLIESSRANREITVRLYLAGSQAGSSEDNLVAAKRDLDAMLQKARLYATRGIGAQVVLQFHGPNGTTTVNADVLDGIVELPEDWLSATQISKPRFGTRASPVLLRLTCKPFLRGTEVTLNNYVRNPDFELGDGGSPVHDWAATNATISRVADPYTGAYAMKVLANCIAGQQGYASQSITWSAATFQGAAVSVNFFYKVPGANNREQRVSIYDGVSESTTLALIDAGYAYVNLTKTLDAAASELTIRVYVNYVAGADVDDYIYVDRMRVDLGTNPGVTAPWISGREISNRDDPDNLNSADDINYVDIRDVGGDAPGLLKFYCTQGQAETRMVFAARHGAANFDDPMLFEFSGNADATAHNQDYQTVNFNHGGAGYLSSANIALTGITHGLYRMFMRFDRQNAAIDLVRVAWAYGGKTGWVADEQATVANYSWYDVGVLTVPPIDLPAGETEPTFNFTIQTHSTGVANVNTRLDAVLLMPIRQGEGFVAADQDAVAYQVLLNSETGVAIMTTASVLVGPPNALVGAPCPVDADVTRVYLLAPGTAALTNTYTVKAKVTPRYLHL